MHRYEKSASSNEFGKLSLAELCQMADQMYSSLVKADVDIEKGVIVFDLELHADGEAELLASGSNQQDIWGINLYPEHFGSEEFVEFDSMINIRPRQGNRSRGIADPGIRQRIWDLVLGAIQP